MAVAVLWPLGPGYCAPRTRVHRDRGATMTVNEECSMAGQPRMSASCLLMVGEPDLVMLNVSSSGRDPLADL